MASHANYNITGEDVTNSSYQICANFKNVGENVAKNMSALDFAFVVLLGHKTALILIDSLHGARYCGIPAF